jgi:hypothetical protein
MKELASGGIETGALLILMGVNYSMMGLVGTQRMRETPSGRV